MEGIHSYVKVVTCVLTLKGMCGDSLVDSSAAGWEFRVIKCQNYLNFAYQNTSKLRMLYAMF